MKETLTVRELLEILQSVAEEVSGDVPVYVCDTQYNDPRPIDLVDTTISDCGCEGNGCGRIDINFGDYRIFEYGDDYECNSN